MKNKYKGFCVDCGSVVNPQQGVLVKIGKKWTVSHNGSCPEAKEPTHKEKYGRCEDAPCCGCCGGGQEYYSYSDFSDPL